MALLTAKPSWASPRITDASTRSAPSWGLVLVFISIVMLRRSKSVVMCLPIAPSGSKATDFACSRARLKASTESMAGFCAPARTATPMPERAMVARLAATTVPCLTSSSMAAGEVRITTSKESPASIWRFELALEPYWMTSLCPVACSNAGPTSSSTGFRPKPVSTLMTAASAAPARAKAMTHPAIIKATTGRVLIKVIARRIITAKEKACFSLASPESPEPGQPGDAASQPCREQAPRKRLAARFWLGALPAEQRCLARRERHICGTGIVRHSTHRRARRERHRRHADIELHRHRNGFLPSRRIALDAGHGEMQVCLFHVAAGAGIAEQLPGFHRLPHGDGDTAMLEVRVDACAAVAVAHPHEIAFEGERLFVPGRGMSGLQRFDDTRARGDNGGALRHGDVQGMQRLPGEVGGDPATRYLGEHERKPVGPWQAIEHFGARRSRPEEADHEAGDPHAARAYAGTRKQ